ncbi:hypothetical protein RJD24_10195 [Bacillaceae bacterium IKA-2]|nr:hypothetical protein RJD24_10195 [Bacillaceae bacterium IKA-2]
MNNELKEMLQSVLKEELDPIKHELQGVKSEMSSMNARMSTIETGMSSMEAKMELGFEEVKDKLRIIQDQTARTSELKSPIYDLQQQVKDHDADIKLIKRVLSS